MNNRCKSYFYGTNIDLESITNKKFELPSATPHFVPDHSVEPEHIKLEIEFDFDKELVSGVTTIFVLVNSPEINQISLDAKNLVIQEAFVDDKSVSFENTGEKVNLYLPDMLSRGNKIVVKLHHMVEKPAAGAYFIKPSPEYPSQHLQVWTQCQDEDASYIFPCFDHPSFKHTSEVIIKNVPSSMIALSNGNLIEKKEGYFHYKFDIRHSVYLMSIVVGDFKEIEDSWKGIPVNFYVHPSRVEDGHRSFDKTKKMVGFFSEFIGVQYAYSRYSQVAVSDFIFGGMENTTITTQTDLTLHDERAHLDFSSDGLVAHELAHQWFGDLLTCKEWGHAWLNESFATYFDALFKEHDLGKEEFDYAMLRNAEAYFSEDSSNYRRPIVYNKYSEPIDLFDAHLYPGGSWRLHMLRQKFGTDEFKKVMKLYVEENKFRNVETIDLQRAFEKVTGTNVDAFFDQWLYKAGYPDLEWAYSWDEKSNLLKMTLKQIQDVEKSQIFAIATKIKIVFADGEERMFPFSCSEKEVTNYLYLDKKPNYVSFDAPNAILKKLTIKTGNEQLKQQIQYDKVIMGRIYAIRSFAKEPTHDKLVFLGQRLHTDNFWGVQEQIAKTLGSIGGPQAEHILVDACSLSHPKARRAVVTALQHFPKSERVFSMLSSLLQEKHDPSYYVESSACLSLGALKLDSAVEVLEQQLEKSSHYETIRQGALQGLAFIHTEKAYSIILNWTKRGKPMLARMTAILSLAKLGKILEPESTFEHLSLLAKESGFRIKVATIKAFGILANKKALGYLEKFYQQEVDGRLKNMAYKTKLAIQKELKKPQELDVLKEEISKLKEENKVIKDTLHKLEAK